MNCLCFGKKRSEDAHKEEIPPTFLTRSTGKSERSSLPRNQSASPSQQKWQHTTTPISQPAHPKNRSPAREDGLTRLAPSPGQETADWARTFDLDIVAIHGLGGHPQKTWMDNESKIAWLEDLLPKDLPNAQIWTYGYNANVKSSKSIADIDDWARALLNELDLERQEAYGQSNRPLIFICHSMGGLVCKKALVLAHEQERYQAILKSTKAVIFFGTPHHGSVIAEFASKAASLAGGASTISDFVFGSGQIRRDLLDMLRTNTKYLDQLALSFKERAQNISAIVSFYETKTMHNLIVVKLASASLGLAKEREIPLPATHTDMCRLTTTDDLAYKTVLNLCRGFSKASFGHQKPLSSNELNCLDSLKPEQYQEQDKDPTPSTCEWILENFDAWQKREKPILWVSGEFGHGKTTSMLFLKDQLQLSNMAVKEGRPDLTICSFFVDSRSEALTNSKLVLRKILWEMLSKRHDLIHHAVTHFDGFSPWSLNRLWRVFKTVMTDPATGNSLILLDGLDECNESMRNELFNNLVSFFKDMQESAPRTIKFVLSSRSGVINRRPEFSELATYLKLDEDLSLIQLIHADIEKYVRMTLSDLLYGRVKAKDEIAIIAKSIADRSEGSFLWTTLILERAGKQFYGDIKHLERILMECPPKLDDIYYQSLQGLEYNQTKIRKAFGIILAAKRPLSLSEFKLALAIETHHGNLEILKATQDEELDFVSFLQDRFGIFIRTHGDTITYSHESVKDFFFNKLYSLETQNPERYCSRIAAWLDLSKLKADGIIAKSCILFLKLEDFAEPRVSFDTETELWEAAGFGIMQLEDEPRSPESATRAAPATTGLDQGSGLFNITFFEYAASKWGYHYANCDPLDPEILEEDELRVITEGCPMKNWSYVFRQVNSDGPELPQELNALLIASYFGHTRSFRKLLSDPQFAASRERSLTWACRMGHYEIVKLLFEDAIPHTHDVLDGQSAFLWAVAEGFVEIVRLLLDKEPTLVNTQNDKGSSPLLSAVENGHLQIVKRLLKTKNVDVELSNKHGIRAIHMAVKGPFTSTEDVGILQMLLDRPELNITAQDRRGRTVLWYAADLGATQIIKRLLGCRQRREDIKRLLHDCGDSAGESPLYRAAFWGYTDVIRVLCETKEVHHQLESIDDLDGANVFDIAAKRGNVGAIELLGRYYPEGVNHQDHTGRTPISTAMWQNKLSVLEALRKCEADVNLADNAGRTPISHGIVQIDLVKYLVKECDANINKPDKAGHTPLWYAKSQSIERFDGIDVVRELILLGAKE